MTMTATNETILVGKDLVVVKDLVKYFPVRSGLLQRVVAWVQAVDGIKFHDSRRRDFGNGGRIRLR